MIELKTPGEIEKMAVTGRFVAEVLDDLASRAEPGINLLDLEQRARAMIDGRGAVSCYWDYAPSFGSGPFRNVICLSVDDAVLHGLPHDRILHNGSVLTLDFAVSIDGWVADAAKTVIVGESDPSFTPDPGDVAMIESTRQALQAGIDAARPGGRLGDISAAIGKVAAAAGYQVNTDFGGHGLGRTMHEDPHIPNTGRRNRGPRLLEGMTLAIEPWWGRGSAALVVDDDGWTLRMADGRNAAHSERTIAITSDGARILGAGV